MKFVLCDDDEMLCSMVDATIATHGHDIVGIADTTRAAVGLVKHGRPDVVVVDPTVGCTTDFDVIDTAIAAGAQVIVFSRNSEPPSAGRYVPEPLFVAKPDLRALEKAIGRLSAHPERPASDVERRERPARTPTGPSPDGPRDPEAFYAALNDAVAGDAFVALSARAGGPRIDVLSLADLVSSHLRGSDRLLMLMTTSSLLVFLAGGGEEGVESLLGRVRGEPHLPAGLECRSIVITPGESPTDAFDRLKHGGGSVRS